MSDMDLRLCDVAVNARGRDGAGVVDVARGARACEGPEPARVAGWSSISEDNRTGQYSNLRLEGAWLTIWEEGGWGVKDPTCPGGVQSCKIT